MEMIGKVPMNNTITCIIYWRTRNFQKVYVF